ncbi:MAG: AraC family transcriptional regulator [Hahellaceae bacterium]|nr:AraC family transcriptional regulator [Hahellaceae bacterium]MCP5168398.1 AraC family transcriptional regulator [Hahellaceae bacterium]
MGQASDTLSVSASSAQSLLVYLTQHGFDGAKVARKAGIKVNTLDNPDSRIPVQVFNRFWEEALSVTHDPALGLHVGEMTGTTEMGIVGHIFFNCETLKQALDQYAAFFSLVNTSMRVDFYTDDDFAYVSYVCEAPESYSRAAMDRLMAISLMRGRMYVHPQLKMHHVGFAHPEPEYASEYQRIFHCPVRFSQPHCTIVFRKHFLNYKLPKRNPYLHQVLTRHVEAILNRIRPRKAITSKVKQLIAGQLAKNNVDAEHIAAELHMSRHTLYRKLKLEDQSFQALIEEVRQEKAIQYLEEGKHSLSEIAFLLGFSELSAFSRAFKRWTGVPPAKWGTK